MSASEEVAVRVSAIVLTHNEAGMIEACLQALAWCVDCHVVDSGSTDETRERAARCGARVYEHGFESFGAQRNWALDHCALGGDWVLFLDADEIATGAFHEAVVRACAGADAEVAGFYLCNKLMLEGRWLKRSGGFPSWQFRLLRRGRARFTDFGHGQKEGVVDGRLDYVREPYEHYAFYKGWTEWLDRHNRYASREAEARLKERLQLSGLFSRHGSRRRVALKLLLTRLPGWPLWRFLGTYVLRGGFLEGRQGWIYCVNMACYEHWIKLKMRELRASQGERCQ